MGTRHEKHADLKVRTYLPCVPSFRQGDDDYLCGYYCAWVLRVATPAKARGAAGEYEACCRGKGLPLRKHVLSGVTPDQLDFALRGYVGPRVAGRATQVWAKVVDQLDIGRPSVIWLPRSDMHPAGHYVVAKGMLTSDGVPYLIVSDPARGERWLSRAEFKCAPLRTARGYEASWCAWHARSGVLGAPDVDGGAPNVQLGRPPRGRTR